MFKKASRVDIGFLLLTAFSEAYESVTLVHVT
jgi:hypothetical protein